VFRIIDREERGAEGAMFLFFLQGEGEREREKERNPPSRSAAPARLSREMHLCDRFRVRIDPCAAVERGLPERIIFNRPRESTNCRKRADSGRTSSTRARDASESVSRLLLPLLSQRSHHPLLHARAYVEIVGSCTCT